MWIVKKREIEYSKRSKLRKRKDEKAFIDRIDEFYVRVDNVTFYSTVRSMYSYGKQ